MYKRRLHLEPVRKGLGGGGVFPHDLALQLNPSPPSVSSLFLHEIFWLLPGYLKIFFHLLSQTLDHKLFHATGGTPTPHPSPQRDELHTSVTIAVLSEPNPGSQDVRIPFIIFFL